MRSEDAYEVARRQFFAVEPRPLRHEDSPLPSREELHDRAGLVYQLDSREPDKQLRARAWLDHL